MTAKEQYFKDAERARQTVADALRKEVSFHDTTMVQIVSAFASIAHRAYLNQLGKLNKKEQYRLGLDLASMCASGALEEMGIPVPNTAHLRARKKATK